MSDDDKKQMDADLARIKAAVATLSEHFDSVHVFASRCEAGTMDGTANWSWGVGNWFARLGQIRNWVIQEDEATRLKVREPNDP